MIDKHLHLRRRKDGVEVITLEAAPAPRLAARKTVWNSRLQDFAPVRYVESGRKGYLKVDHLEHDFVVIGKDVDIDARWAPHVRNRTGPSASALETIRERDVQQTRKRILEGVNHPQPGDSRALKQLAPSPNAVSALDQAIHMILAGL